MIRELRQHEAEAYVELRRQALMDTPLAFASSPVDDFVSSTTTVKEELRRAPEFVIIGAFDGDLIGTVGLYRGRHVKASHKAHLWGMYVKPSHRQQRVGSQLLDAALIHAKMLPGVRWVHLSVTSAAPAAQRIYERAGFRVWGTEPEALCHDGRSVVEHHMALCLQPRNT
jgi:ribosomal protein S18 acetylase RimI-like enzyme